MTETAQVDVFFISDRGGWTTEVIEIPKAVADTESQDAFIKWVYSDEGDRFRAGWGSNILAVFVCSWDPEEFDDEEEK